MIINPNINGSVGKHTEPTFENSSILSDNVLLTQ